MTEPILVDDLQSIPSLNGNTFNNKLWRKLLAETCKTIEASELKLDVISPFGFEILNDKRFLSGNLRRFYCYIGINNSLNFDVDEIAIMFKEALFSKLKKRYPDFHNQIVVIIENDKLTKLKKDDYTCTVSNKLIDIQVRKTNGDILDDYAHYIISTLDSLRSFKGECSNYQNNLITRWRMYQLFMMQEKLLEDILPPLSNKQNIKKQRMLMLISNMIQLFYSPHLITSFLNEEELNIINILIIPRVKQMMEAVAPKSTESSISFSIKTYHITSDVLDITLEKTLYQQLLEKIKKTYMEFYE